MVAKNGTLPMMAGAIAMGAPMDSPLILSGQAHPWNISTKTGLVALCVMELGKPEVAKIAMNIIIRKYKGCKL